MKRSKPSLHKLKAEADKSCRAYHQGLPCVVCGRTHGTVGHHIIPRSHGATRHSPENIIPLCPDHHTGNADICAHSTNAKSRLRFVQWLWLKMPDTVRWTQKHRHDACVYQADDYERLAQYWREKAWDTK